MKMQILKTFYEILKRISRDNCARYFKNHYPTEYNELMAMTSFLEKFNDKIDKNKKISIFERIYCIENDLTDRPKCVHCKTRYVCGFNKQKNEYKKWCSASCQASDPRCIAESKNTRKTKYGNENYCGIEKARSTRKANNGGKWHSDDFGDAVRAAKIANGHPENWVNPEKSAATRLSKYGDANFNNKEKNKLTRKTNFYNTVLLNDKNVAPLFSLDEYIHETKHTVFEWKCLKCGNVFRSRLNYNFKNANSDGIRVRCQLCFPYEVTKKSKCETELFDFVKQFDPTCIQSDRTLICPYELDILSTSRKIAIEYDGLYWHSDEFKNKNYHRLKTEECAKKGIQLIHIFENEWTYKNEIVKSRISNLFGKYEKIVYARKCVVSEISSLDARHFLNENHIQGCINSPVRIGLYLDKTLVSLMTFSKCRFGKKYEWEMTRFCNKLYHHIPGAASRLMKYFENKYKPTSVVSYADMRWSNGKLYYTLGFNFSHMSNPDYWYFICKSDILHSRIKFQKHKLKNLLEIYDDEKSEVENMKANGYSRIFDCGNMVFEKLY